jgi:predicted membrane protein
MKISKWFWGAFFICAAAAVILHALGHFADISIWSIIFTAVLIPIIISSLLHRFFAGILFPLAIIAILFSAPLGFEALSPWAILAAALFLSIALTIMFKKKKTFSVPFRSSHNFGENYHTYTAGYNTTHEETVEHIESNDVNCSVSFGSSIKYLHCDALRKADISCSFGAIQVFFDDTQLHPDGAVINVSCSFGSIEMYVPKSWNIKNEATAVFGAAEIKNPYTHTDDGPPVTLKGGVSFGSVEVIHV